MCVCVYQAKWRIEDSVLGARHGGHVVGAQTETLCLSRASKTLQSHLSREQRKTTITMSKLDKQSRKRAVIPPLCSFIKYSTTVLENKYNQNIYKTIKNKTQINT